MGSDGFKNRCAGEDHQGDSSQAHGGRSAGDRAHDAALPAHHRESLGSPLTLCPFPVDRLRGACQCQAERSTHRDTQQGGGWRRHPE
jgi:hypothetical protein